MRVVIGAAVVLVALIVTSPARAQSVTDAAMGKLRAMIGADGCSAARGEEEIVVCGRRRPDDRYRLPLPTDTPVAGGAVRGEVPSASPDRLASGPCGIFQGQRRCSKAEGLVDGYGGGRDPLSLLLKAVTLLADPDAVVSQPAPIPKPINRSK